MGFIEETGAAQHLRDARITTIYEGTTGIQANDLIGRKLSRDGGQTAKAVIGMMKALDHPLAKHADIEMAAIRARLAAAARAAEECVDWIVQGAGQDVRNAYAGAVPFLKLMGITAAGWQMARAALVARTKLAGGANDGAFYQAKITTARFFADHFLSQVPGLRDQVVQGGASVMALAEDQF